MRALENYYHRSVRIGPTNSLLYLYCSIELKRRFNGRELMKNAGNELEISFLVG